MDGISPQDQDLVARTMLAEGGDQGDNGLAAIAHVIRNRALGNDPDFPRDVTGVIECSEAAAKAAGAGKLVAVALDVTATFLPPDARRRDTDGMFSSIKAYLDGLADASGIDDSNFNLSIRRGDIVRNGLVRLEIEPRAA